MCVSECFFFSLLLCCAAQICIHRWHYKSPSYARTHARCNIGVHFQFYLGFSLFFGGLLLCMSVWHNPFSLLLNEKRLNSNIAQHHFTQKERQKKSNSNKHHTYDRHANESRQSLFHFTLPFKITYTTHYTQEKWSEENFICVAVSCNDANV